MEDPDIQHRTIDQIQNDLSDLPRIVGDQTRSLDESRRKIAGWLGSFDAESPAWKGIIDSEEFAQLSQQEEQAEQRLSAIQTRIQNDREAVSAVGYQSALDPQTQAIADQKADRILARLEHTSAPLLAQQLRDAVLRDDRAELGAFAQVRDQILSHYGASTTLPNLTKTSTRALFRDGFETARRVTGDRSVEALRESLDTAHIDISRAITEIAQRRNAHQPGSMGGALLRHQFGARETPEERQRARRYDAAAVMTRLGR